MQFYPLKYKFQPQIPRTNSLEISLVFLAYFKRVCEISKRDY
jgi:hypothetical protein